MGSDRFHARFTGVVLTGGRSTRMGTDKAFLRLPQLDKSLASVSLDALRDAGATRVLSVGGDVDRLADLGFDAHPDDHPDEGPLGGLITGLRLANMRIVVLTCDLPAIDGTTIRDLVDVLAEDVAIDAAVPLLDDRRQILTAAYRRSVLEVLRASFESGERSVRRAVAGVRVLEVDGIDPDKLRDLDRPDDLDRWNR